MNEHFSLCRDFWNLLGPNSLTASYPLLTTVCKEARFLYLPLGGKRKKAPLVWATGCREKPLLLLPPRCGKSDKVSSGGPRALRTGPYPRGWQCRYQALPLAGQDEGTRLHSGYPCASGKQKRMTLTSEARAPRRGRPEFSGKVV